MKNQNIHAEKITRPIQFLAVWFVGLSLINGSFLATAATIGLPQWVGIVLVFASIINVLIVLRSLYIFLTKYRPELQDDEHYALYLNNDMAQKDYSLNMENKSEVLINALKENNGIKEDDIRQAVVSTELIDLAHKHGYKRTIFELFQRQKEWGKIVSQFGHANGFEEELESLKQEGLIEFDGNDPKSASLTILGKQVAQKALEIGKLYTPPVE